MFNYRIAAGSTDVSVVIRIIDSSDGTPETAVEHDTSGIDLEYRREGAVSTDITEAALAALTTAHTDGGIEHIGNGYYRLDLPDAACAASASGVLVHGTVTDMVVIGCYIHLEPVPANVVEIAGDSDAADNLSASALTIIPGTVDTTAVATTTTTFEADDITEATADHYNGRIVIFKSGALENQATDITDYALNGGRGAFTVTALTEAPANDDTFIII